MGKQEENMSKLTCPVNNTLNRLSDIICSNRLKNPKSRRIAEEILELINDIAWGRAGDEHLPAIESLAQELIQEVPSQSCV